MSEKCSDLPRLRQQHRQVLARRLFRESAHARLVHFPCSDALFLPRIFVAKTYLLGACASASKREAPPREISAPCVCLWRLSLRDTLALSNGSKNALLRHARPTNDNPPKKNPTSAQCEQRKEKRTLETRFSEVHYFKKSRHLQRQLTHTRPQT